MKIQYSGGTGISSCLNVSKTTSKNVKDKKQTSQ